MTYDLCVIYIGNKSSRSLDDLAQVVYDEKVMTVFTFFNCLFEWLITPHGEY